MKNKMELTFSAAIENEAFARTSVASFVGLLNPTIDEVVEIKTIVSEGVSNAIIHGYNGDSNKDVIVKVSVDNYEVKIVIQDYGKGIEDIDKAREAMYTSLKELEHAGMGLTIIEALCDELKINSTVGLGTQLIILKKLKANGFED